MGYILNPLYEELFSSGDELLRMRKGSRAPRGPGVHGLGMFLWKVFRQMFILVLGKCLGNLGRNCGGIWAKFGGEALKDITVH